MHTSVSLFFLLLSSPRHILGGIFSSCCGSKDEVHEIKGRPPKYSRPPLWAQVPGEYDTKHAVKTTYTNPKYTPSPTPKRTPFDWECTDILTVIPNIASIDRYKMKQVCQSRFAELHRKHNEHQSLIQYEPINVYSSNPNGSVDPNSHLIVLDMDETIMDQRSFSKSDRVHEPDVLWKSVNAKDLIINFNQFTRRHNLRRSTKTMSIGIFRPYFMDFLGFVAATRQNDSSNTYEAMLYSAAIGELVIYHAVTMEMYYNFVYAVKYKLQKFEFKHVVSRAKDIRFSAMKRPKSLELLMRLIGNYGRLLSVYKHIVIMDDMESKVWNDAVPQEMVDNEMNIVCYAPWEYSFNKFRSEPVDLSDALLSDMMKIRYQDYTFRQMMKELENLPQQHGVDRLKWYQYGGHSLVEGMG